MRFTVVFFAALFLVAHVTIVQGGRYSLTTTIFDYKLELLEMYLRYTFRDRSLLYRAMTHSSFSHENNEALSILGAKIIETTVSIQRLSKDVDISAKELNRKLSLTDSSCAADGRRFRLHCTVRVSHNTNSSSTDVLCGAFRSIFAAIALDDPSSPEDAAHVFLRVHGRQPEIPEYLFD